jgi:hypothetical protein
MRYVSWHWIRLRSACFQDAEARLGGTTAAATGWGCSCPSRKKQLNQGCFGVVLVHRIVNLFFRETCGEGALVQGRSGETDELLPPLLQLELG